MLELLGLCGRGQRKHLRGDDLNDDKEAGMRIWGESCPGRKKKKLYMQRPCGGNELGLLEEQMEGASGWSKENKDRVL